MNRLRGYCLRCRKAVGGATEVFLEAPTFFRLNGRVAEEPAEGAELNASRFVVANVPNGDKG